MKLLRFNLKHTSNIEKSDRIYNAATQQQLGLDRLFYLYGNVPNPNGDFTPPCDAPCPYRAIEITPYGYEAYEDNSCFRLPLEKFAPEVRTFKLFFKFISYPEALNPYLVIDYNNNAISSTKIPVPVVDHGVAEVIFSVQETVKSIFLFVGLSSTIFRFKEFNFEANTLNELASTCTKSAKQPIDIICFPIIDWDYRFQRPQQLLSLCADNGHRVFYISTSLIGLHQNCVQCRSIRENVFNISLPGNERLVIYHHQVTPHTLTVGIDALRKFLYEQNCSEALLLVNLPFWLPYAERLRNIFGWKIVYDCMDDHSGFEHNQESMLCLDEEIAKKADLLVVSSEKLYQAKSEHNNNCILIRNAGDFEHFSSSYNNKFPSIANFPKPVIGYYGAVAEWFDTESIKLAAIRHPEWSFVIIGYMNLRNDLYLELCQLNNIYFLGEKPYSILPQYLADFDICTIPFRLIPLTEATNPVKVYEYLASGKPVVARNLPELYPLKELVKLYDSPESFVSQLEGAVSELNNQSSEIVESRRNVARQNTWKDRHSILFNKVEQLYPKVAIIIVSYHQLEYLHDCLNSVLRNTQYPNFEIIVVDNASNKDVVSYLKLVTNEVSNVKVIFNDTNKGFAAANNQGILAAYDAEFIALLNNDTVVPPGWLSRLIWYSSQPDIGLVGPVTNCIGNEAQIGVNYKDLKEMEYFARARSYSYFQECFDIKVLAMYCMVMRRDVLNEVGLLDESFSIGMFEDDDFAERVRAANYRVVCAEDVFVHHYGSKSFSKLSKDDYQTIFDHNKKIFENKWGTWIPHKYR